MSSTMNHSSLHSLATKGVAIGELNLIEPSTPPLKIAPQAVNTACRFPAVRYNGRTFRCNRILSVKGRRNLFLNLLLFPPDGKVSYH